LFERVRVGSATEQAQLAAARGEPVPQEQRTESAGERGRAVLFFLDDYHLGPTSLEQTRRVIAAYADRSLGPRDVAVVGSASGQFGFLEQVSGSATLLKAAAARVSSRARNVVDVDIPRMLPLQAQMIDRGSNRDLYEFFVRETLRQNPFMKREAAEGIVNNRARTILQQTAAIARDTLIALDRFIRSKGDLPGRKLVFFLSDGFLMDPLETDLTNRLRTVADVAARTGTVIYTIDARGLIGQPSFDASRPGTFANYSTSNPTLTDDPSVLIRSEPDELFSSQDPLFRIAAETGGRAIMNTNALTQAVPQVLNETSVYYVLAWSPPIDKDAKRNERFHKIHVSTIGRPELRVRVPLGVYDSDVPNDRRTEVTPSIATTVSVDEALLAALRSPYPVLQLPTSMTLEFLDLPKVGTVIKASAHLSGESAVDIAAAVFNDHGQGVASLKDHVNLRDRRATFTQQFQVKPGLYQVRLSVRDAVTGKVGSAMDWIDVPAVGGPFSMSGLFVDHEAPRLRFLTYVYNAGRPKKAAPDVTLKIEVFRGDKRVVATPNIPLKTVGAENLSRLPYFGELNLEGLPSGSYVLQVTATDRATNLTLLKRTSFEIE
jgi:VWFA-related protein